VAAELEEQILADRMPAGAHIALRSELIVRFGVSASVMNEALRILRERNLVAVKSGPGGGVFVSEPPPQIRLGAVNVWHQGLGVDPQKLFEARSLLDTLFASAAMQRATPDDIRAMEWALDGIRSAMDNDPVGWINAIMRLHLAIARACRVELLVGLYETIISALTITMTKAAFVDGSEELRRHNIEVHTQLVQAIKHQDGAALEKVLALHDQDMKKTTDQADSSVSGEKVAG
jgi:DNA-binding FadR family transcriptional regulator